MKKVVVLICILISFGFGKFQCDYFILSVVKIDKSNLESIRVVLKLRNNSTRKIKYLTNSCAVSDFFKTNNSQVAIIRKSCDKNVSVILELEPKSAVKFKININLKEQQTGFKLAFNLLEVPDVIKIDENNQSKLVARLIWTDEIKL